jgi:hypothetical protein
MSVWLRELQILLDQLTFMGDSLLCSGSQHRNHGRRAVVGLYRQ